MSSGNMVILELLVKATIVPCAHGVPLAEPWLTALRLGNACRAPRRRLTRGGSAGRHVPAGGDEATGETRDDGRLMRPHKYDRGCSIEAGRISEARHAAHNPPPDLARTGIIGPCHAKYFAMRKALPHRNLPNLGLREATHCDDDPKRSLGWDPPPCTPLHHGQPTSISTLTRGGRNAERIGGVQERGRRFPQ